MLLGTHEALCLVLSSEKLKTNPTVYFSNLSLMWGLLEEGEHERESATKSLRPEQEQKLGPQNLQEAPGAPALVIPRVQHHKVL